MTIMSRAAGRTPIGAARCAFHLIAVRRELRRAGFTRTERKMFLAAWGKPVPALTLGEVCLLDRHYGQASS